MRLFFYQLFGGIGCDANNNITPQIMTSMIDQKYHSLMNIPNNTKIGTINLLMDDDSNITDFVSQSTIPATGLLINDKTLGVLRTFNLQPEIEYYSVTIEFNDQHFSYHWVNPVFDYFNLVDFQKTTFYRQHMLNGGKTAVTVTNFKDFFRKAFQSDALQRLTTDTFKVSNIERIETLDLFLFSVNNSILVSPRLKTEIERHNLTAVEFSEEPIVIEL